MSIEGVDVEARLRAAGEVEAPGFDVDYVLVMSRRALWRRRSRQAIGACVIAAAVFVLALAGPMRVPGFGYVVLPGSEQVRGLVGWETEIPRCTDEDLTVEWGEVSSQIVPVLYAGYVVDHGTKVRSSTFEGGPLPSGKISYSDLLLPDVARVLSTRAEADRRFSLVPHIDDGYGRLARANVQVSDGTHIWWTSSEFRTLSGVVRCDGLAVTPGGEPSADVTIRSWSGTDSSGIVDCAAPPVRPTAVENGAMAYCSRLN